MSDTQAPQQPEVATRRAKQLMINPYEFMFLFTKGLEFKKHTKIIEGLPADASLIGVAYDVRRDAIIMVVESEQYEPIPITDMPPVQLVSLQTGLPGATKKKNVPARKKK